MKRLRSASGKKIHVEYSFVQFQVYFIESRSYFSIHMIQTFFFRCSFCIIASIYFLLTFMRTKHGILGTVKILQIPLETLIVNHRQKEAESIVLY